MVPCSTGMITISGCCGAETSFAHNHCLPAPFWCKAGAAAAVTTPTSNTSTRGTASMTRRSVSSIRAPARTVEGPSFRRECSVANRVERSGWLDLVVAGHQTTADARRTSEATGVGTQPSVGGGSRSSSPARSSAGDAAGRFNRERCGIWGTMMKTAASIGARSTSGAT